MRFNTAGPVSSKHDYCIPPLSRVSLDKILAQIGRMRYFVMHGPSQTGKTSTLLALQDYLNKGGEHRCLYVNFECGHAAGEDTGRAMRALLASLASRACSILQDDFVEERLSAHLEKYGPDAALRETLGRWAQSSRLPLVLMVDEIDTLVGDTLVSVLRQLAAGYGSRPDRFPQTVILCGVQDVREYQILSDGDGASFTGGSALDMETESLRLADFSVAEVHQLLAQHTAECGQAFEEGVAERIWSLTLGQPWLVSALAHKACARAGKESRGRNSPIDLDSIDQAREELILGRGTHFRQFTDRLDEMQVRRVILPMLAGSENRAYSSRDLEYVRSLGLVSVDREVRMANPMYAEAIPRELTLVLESILAGWVEPDRYVNSDGSLGVARLLNSFQGWFRENAELCVERFGHKEAGPQLSLQAYLQLVVTSRGHIERDYAVGRGRTDLLIKWRQVDQRGRAQIRQYLIECRSRTAAGDFDRLIRKGREQASAYMDRCGAESGHLVIFDLLADMSWDDRLYGTAPVPGESPITVWDV
ncbi:MAG: AAA family ATPase [Bryobacterales bacterium]|nr:AAA family ATPase [Bryobacterales bacterium]